MRTARSFLSRCWRENWFHECASETAQFWRAPLTGAGESMNLVFLGLSITSSWGNGHATTYRGLIRELAKRGHEVLFLERDQHWYAENRDLPNPPYCRAALYTNVQELRTNFSAAVREADCVIVGSYVPEGLAVGDWVRRTAHGITAFYDIDTPITLAQLAQGTCDYVSRSRIESYDLYLSFTGGPTLELIEKKFGSPAARAFYCSVDPEQYSPTEADTRWDLGYLGTYSHDRQPTLEALLFEPARQLPAQRFIVAGPQYPASIHWPENVERSEHLSPAEHRAFYNAQRFTLNVTRAEMIRAGWSPSVRLFEAAACGVPIISDVWEGLETFFAPGEEILLARDSETVRQILHEMPEAERRDIGERARQRVVGAHTAAHRAAELETLIGSEIRSFREGFIEPEGSDTSPSRSAARQPLTT